MKSLMPMAYPAPRVSQLDGHILDTELNDLLIEQLKDCFKLLPLWRFTYAQHSDFYSLLLKLFVYRLTVGRRSASYGLLLQNLKLTDAGTHKPIGFNKKTALFGLIIVEYLYKKAQLYLYLFDHEGEVQGTGIISDVKRWLVRHHAAILKFLDNTLKMLNLINFVLFLTDGKHINLVYRVLGITLTPIIADLLKYNGNSVNFEFQNRQLVWNVMTEFLVFLMPLLQLNKLWTGAKRLVLPRSAKKHKGDKITPYTNLPINQCAICHENNFRAAQMGEPRLESLGEITNAYETNCGHLYCYVCLALRFNLMDIRGTTEHCLRCGEGLKFFHEYGVSDDEDSQKAVDLDAVIYGVEADDSDVEVDWMDEKHNPEFMPHVLESYNPLEASEDSEYDDSGEEGRDSEGLEIDEDLEEYDDDLLNDDDDFDDALDFQ